MQAQKNEKRENPSYRILVVDDNNAHLHLLETWLRESGFSVIAVRDGYEAIDRFNNEHFDLVLTDICMPGLNGNILAQYIHTIREDVPVVAVTASPFLAYTDFDLVLSKPCELEGLVNSLQYVLQRIPSPASNLNNIKRRLLHQLRGFEHGHQAN